MAVFSCFKNLPRAVRVPHPDGLRAGIAHHDTAAGAVFDQPPNLGLLLGESPPSPHEILLARSVYRQRPEGGERTLVVFVSGGSAVCLRRRSAVDIQRPPRQWLTAALGVVAIVGMAIPRSWLFVFGESQMHITCSVLFLLGALCALWSDKVIISTVWLAVIFLAANNYARTPAFPPLFLIFTCYFVLCFGFSKFLSAIHLPGDYSYGIYIYGWPAQQLVAKCFPHWSPPGNAATSFAVALGVAALSWHLIEKPSLAQKGDIGSPRQRKKAVAIAAGCAVAILIAIAAGGLTPAVGPMPVEGEQAGEQLGAIEAFGPREVVAGKPFNVQPSGSSAMWVQLSSSVSAKSSIVFRNFKLKTVVSGNFLTAIVPDELFVQPGEADIYVVDETYSPPRRSSSVRMTVLSPAQ